MNTSHQLLPPEWNGLAADLAQSSGINDETAALLMLQAYGVASGNSVQVRTPEWRELGLAFNIGLISTGVPTARGALVQLLGPIPDFVKLAADQLRDAGMGVEAIKSSLEKLKQELGEIKETLRKDKAALEHSKTKEAQEARVKGGGQNFGYLPEAPNVIEARIQSAEQRRNEILRGVDFLVFKLRRVVLADEPDWLELPHLAEQSFDQGVLALCFEKGPADILNLSPKERADCARTLKQHRIGARAVTVITCGPESAYSDVLCHGHLRRILSDFLFMDVGAKGAPAVRPLQETQALAKWHELILKRWNRRVALHASGCDLYVPDAKGFAAMIEFRKWVEGEQGRSPKIASHLSFLVDMPLRFALGRASMSNADGDLSIPSAYVEQAIDFLKRIGRRHRELLDRIMGHKPDGEIIEEKVLQLVEKLGRRGALTKRDLARTFHHQDYATLEPILAHALKAGNIIQAGNLFRVANVSVSASA